MCVCVCVCVCRCVCVSVGKQLSCSNGGTSYVLDLFATDPGSTLVQPGECCYKTFVSSVKGRGS